MSKYPDIAQRIHELAKALCVDQQTLGTLAGVSKQAAGKWFAGESRPQHAALVNLKKKAGVSDEWIIEGRGSMLINTPVLHAVREGRTTYHHTDQEQRLLQLYNKLNAVQQSAVLALLESIA